MQLWKKLFRLFNNLYFLIGSVFLIWITFFDSEDLITQYTLWHKVKKLEAAKEYYIQQIKIIEKERKELINNEELLEKFAREKYYMRKPKEDLYIIINNQLK